MYNLICIIIVLALILTMKKRSFNDIEVWYIIYMYLIFLIYNKTKYKKTVLLLMWLHPTTRLAFMFLTGLLICFLVRSFRGFRATSICMYTLCINTDISHLEQIEDSSIIIANYPSNYIEYFVQGLFGEKLCVLVSSEHYHKYQYLYGTECLVPVIHKEFERTQELVRGKIMDGYKVFAYAEKSYATRESPYHCQELRSGMFRIAKSVGCKITPVVVDHLDHSFGILRTETKFKIVVGETINVTDIEDDRRNVQKFMQKTLDKMKYKL